MSSGQQGLFSSVLGFLSREVQDFVSTATGSSTSGVSVHSFAMALTIKILLTLIAMCRESLLRRARIAMQMQIPNERYGTPGEKDCMRAIKKSATKRKNGESNSTRFADPPVVFDPPAARHTLQRLLHHAERTRIRAVLPPRDVKKCYPRKKRLCPAERHPHLVHPHHPPTIALHTTGTTKTQTQRLPLRKKNRRSARHNPFPACCTAGRPSRCPGLSSLAAHRWTQNQPLRHRSAMYTSQLGPPTLTTRCACRARRAPQSMRAPPAPAPSPVDPARHRSAR